MGEWATDPTPRTDNSPQRAGSFYDINRGGVGSRNPQGTIRVSTIGRGSLVTSRAAPDSEYMAFRDGGSR